MAAAITRTYCYGMWRLAKAGIRGGTIVGESDNQAAYVKDRPDRAPADTCATIYECHGIALRYAGA